MDQESKTYTNLSTLKKIRHKLDISTGSECEDVYQENTVDEALQALDIAIDKLESLFED